MVSQLRGNGCFARKGWANDPYSRRACVHSGLFSVVDGVADCIRNPALGHVIDDDLLELILLDILEDVNVFVLTFFLL